jgi:LacI family repressor for deo operon, udp, cdd, tsx, nupC, and nupG
MVLNTFEKSKRYQEIKRKLCNLLIEEWHSNDRLPPIKDIARELGVGQSSTHQAVKELVRDGILVSKPKMGTYVSDLSVTKPKLEKLINNHNYYSNSPSTSRLIQLLTYEITHQKQTFFTSATIALSNALQKAGYRIVNTSIPKADATDIEPLLDPQAKGVVVINPSFPLQLKCLPNQVMTIINPSSECTLAMGNRFDLIAVDDTQGSLLAGEYLRHKGWTDVAFLGTKYDIDPIHYDKISLKRLEGLTIGLGKPIRPEWQLSAASYTTFCGAAAIGNWQKLNPRPQAIFAASDDLAYGFIHGAIAYGFTPGRDFQIIGFDSQQQSPFYLGKTLTSVAIPITEMGIIAAKMLIKRIEEPNLTPQRIYLGCQLFEGNTVEDAHFAK